MPERWIKDQVARTERRQAARAKTPCGYPIAVPLEGPGPSGGTPVRLLIFRWQNSIFVNPHIYIYQRYGPYLSFIKSTFFMNLTGTHRNLALNMGVHTIVCSIRLKLPTCI